MDYLFLDDFNPTNLSKIKDKKNVMVIYGQRITELPQELSRNNDSISDFQFILKSLKGKSKKQKYISINQNSLQVKIRDVGEEIEKKKKQIQKEKDMQKQTSNYVRLISKENYEKKNKEEQKKIEKEQENLITKSVPNIIPPPISDSSELYQPINNFDLNRIDVEEPSSKTPIQKETPKPQPKKKNGTPISYTPTYTPNTTFSSITPPWSTQSSTPSSPSSRSSSAPSSASPPSTSVPSSPSSTPSTPVSTNISPQQEYSIMLISGKEISRCNTNSRGDVTVLKVNEPLPFGSYDFADLNFYKLFLDNDLVGIIEVVESGDSIIFQLVHLAPQNRFKIPNYYSYIRLYAELSKKYQSAYKIFKENPTVNPTSITPAKKKAYTSSPLVFLPLLFILLLLLLLLLLFLLPTS
jgi:hypothetical protein